jgi:hypothetical protein
MSVFVRESFYLPPPKPGSPVSTWEAWLKADRQMAINAKRAHTMSLKAEPENAIRLWSHGSGMPIAGKDGVHRQSQGFIGFQDAGSERTEVVAAVAATQDRYHSPRGTDGAEIATSQSRTERRQANKSAKRLKLLK